MLAMITKTESSHDTRKHACKIVFSQDFLVSGTSRSVRVENTISSATLRASTRAFRHHQSVARVRTKRMDSEMVPFSTHLRATPCVAPFRTIAVPNCHVKISPVNSWKQGANRTRQDSILAPDRCADLMIKSCLTTPEDLSSTITTL